MAKPADSAGRVHPGFQRDPAARHPPEPFLHRFRSCAQLLLQHDFALFIQHANTKLERSPRSNPIVRFGWEKFLPRYAATVLISFIVGFLCLLRFKRVDNLGAYRIPSESGIFISSDFTKLSVKK